MRWCYTLIFNVLYAIKQRLMVDNKIAKESVKREVIAGERLYTLLVYSENVAGVLNQIAAVFTRRQVNIESLNVSASSIEGIHKYTITAWSDAATIEKITKQVEKKIDVIKADYYEDSDLFIHEVGLYKIANAHSVRKCRGQPCNS